MDFDTIAYIRHSMASFSPGFVMFIALLVGSSVISGCIAIYVAIQVVFDALRDGRARRLRREPWIDGHKRIKSAPSQM